MQARNWRSENFPFSCSSTGATDSIKAKEKKDLSEFIELERKLCSHLRLNFENE